MKGFIIGQIVIKVIQNINKEDVGRAIDGFLDPLEEKYTDNALLTACFKQIRIIGSIPEFDE